MPPSGMSGSSIPLLLQFQARFLQQGFHHDFVDSCQHGDQAATLPPALVRKMARNWV
jgi:hypothetical protein